MNLVTCVILKIELTHFNKQEEDIMLILKINLIDAALYCVILDV